MPIPESGPGELFVQADALFGGMPDGVLIQRGGRIVYANRRASEILGLGNPERLLGMVSLELYSDSDLPAVLARIQSAHFGRPIPAGRHCLCRPDGNTIQVEVSCLLLRLADAPLLIEILRVTGGEPGVA